jgi:hypothetical protein
LIIENASWIPRVDACGMASALSIFVPADELGNARRAIRPEVTALSCQPGGVVVEEPRDDGR